MTEILRYTAFSTDPDGGNRAGVVLDAGGWDAARMLETAASVGYSETAFAVPTGDRSFDVRYFSPVVEVPFCGHATVATAVALGERIGDGDLVFETAAGRVRVGVSGGRARLTSVPTRSVEAPAEVVDGALRALGWDRDDVSWPVHVAHGGAGHLVIGVGRRERLASLDYDFAALAEVLRSAGLITAHLFHQRSEDVFDVREPFPVGGVVEDAATGAAAAAFGGYLRALGLVSGTRTLVIHQGVEMGRASELVVEVEEGDARVSVSGAAVALGA
ncbi:PhzF family phenazine biosynthesis protein [Umezawaea endophytica]|uniref:PhzF family phenazine biosynthesis protein n=1 Tax=Umezawaea endophytica TaxID=1654476 RepID=A0A9X2VLQ4_9PSEU|nr:PhzF family phenazine biosynthesis protein [Umezawaea endophytica]MCS7479013.1 PhzF family phenazine biosynthesis protein [Umezawaea endophytica]